MNRIAGRAWAVVLLSVALISGLVFFLCEYTANAGKWVVFSGSPHVYNGSNINCGVVVDRDSFLLLDMTQDRQYSADAQVRKATVHWIGDRQGSIYAPALPYYSTQIAGFDLLNGVYHYGKQTAVTELTLSATVQKAALEALGEHKGTVAVYNYKTGQILCAVTTPTYDPDNIPNMESDAYEGVYLNRFTQSTYTPGSIFKIVTLAAALETIPDIKEQTFVCEGSYEIAGDKITCENSHGTQDLKTAFCNSCNCAFAQIALQLGDETLQRYVDQFGIIEPIAFDGITTEKGNFDVKDAADVNLAWSAVGQYNDQINPAAFLQFLGAIANDGRGVAPYIVEQVKLGDNTTYKAKILENNRVLSAGTASTLQEYMGFNVSEKYGSENFPGLTVCAKTGTAEVTGKKPNAMLAGFTTDDACPFAFIVCVEDAGYGRTVCIPVASQVLTACKEAVLQVK